MGTRRGRIFATVRTRFQGWNRHLGHFGSLYSNGRSEEIITKTISTYNIPRDELVLMTKCRFGTSRKDEPQMSMYAATINNRQMVNRVGLSCKHIFDAVQASMKRLGTYIDVLQIQRMDPDVPHNEIMKALNDVVEQGWVLCLGASSMPIWELQMLQNVAETHGWHKFISMRNYYNLLYREEEMEMIPFCRVTDVGCMPVCFRYPSVFIILVISTF